MANDLHIFVVQIAFLITGIKWIRRHFVVINVYICDFRLLKHDIINLHKKVHFNNFQAHFQENDPKSSVTSQNQSLQIKLWNVMPLICLKIRKKEEKWWNYLFDDIFSSTTTWGDNTAQPPPEFHHLRRRNPSQIMEGAAAPLRTHKSSLCPHMQHYVYVTPRFSKYK